MPETQQPTILHDADWYEHPKWYDVLHWPGTMAEARGLVRIAHRFTGWSDPASAAASIAPAASDARPLHAFEPACGTARHLRALAKLGCTGLGIDLSRPMLDYGNRLLRLADAPVELLHADMTAFEPPDVGADTRLFDIAFCLANSVRHLPSDGLLAEHLRRVARVLRPSGVYALGIGLTRYGAEQDSEDIWHGARGPLRITQMVQYLPPTAPGDRLERVVSQLAVNRPKGDAFVEHSYDLRTYDSGEFAAVLDQAGMAVEAVVDEDGADLWPGDPDRWRDSWMGYGVFVLRSKAG